MNSSPTNRTSRVLRLPPPKIDTARLATPEDVPVILSICNEPMKKTFRIDCLADIQYLIENSVLAVSLLSEKGDVIGFIAVREYPQIPSVHPGAWEDYIWTKYKAISLNARNTLWIHLLCWHKLYSREVVDTLLQTVFKQDPYVLNICFIKTLLEYPLLVPGSSRAEGSFRRVQASERGVPGDQLPMMLVADRVNSYPKLRVRRAVEEDNDDIVPIIERHSQRLRELYGDFYISELISRHPESERELIVCEHNELAVGIMILNTVINFESLEECYELSPFAGLRHLDEPPFKHRNRDTDSNSNVSDGGGDAGAGQSACVVETMAIHDIRDLCDNEIKDRDQPGTESQMGRVTWMEDHRASNVSGFSKYMVYDSDGNLVSNESFLEFIDALTREEDDQDYDIVNIDPDHLIWPMGYFNLSDGALSRSINGLYQAEKKEEDTEDNLGSKREKKKVLAGSAKAPEHVTRYSGTSNAFLIEVCAMQEGYDERYTFDMLEVAFEMLEDKDYCIISVPSSQASFPLLEHFTLVTPHPTRLRFANESLYVAHVNSVRGDVKVRLGEMVDLEGLIDLVEHAAHRDTLTSLFEQALTSLTMRPYMLLAQKQPIGVIIVGPLEDNILLRTQHVVSPEPVRLMTDGVILGCTMSPIMEPHARWYLRDVLRQSPFNTLFWLCAPFAKGDQAATRNMMALTERMVPIRTRASLPNLTGHAEIDKVFRDLKVPLAVWMIEKPLTSCPKVNVNNSIVVVGASRTGLAFLEELILGSTSKYLSFTNLTLVSDHGLPTVAECLKAAITAIPRQGRHNDHYLKSIPFCFYVDVLPATLVEIDRKKKCIRFNTGGVQFYDELILTVGQQFQHPDYLKSSLETAKEVRKGKPCERTLMDNPKYQPDRVPPPPPMPDNLFLINSTVLANVVFRKLYKMMANRTEELTQWKRIVVYGDCIEAYSCIAALLEMGVHGDHIAFVENYPPEDPAALRVNCFNDEDVDGRVQAMLQKLNIKTYRKCRLNNMYVRHKHLYGISLMDPLHLIELNCFALFYFGIKDIDIHAFKAINESGLVYDGGLVVSPQFETNDPHIYGAGTCCNYSRRLYSVYQNHKYYNSEEVGQKLAQIFLQKMNPFTRCHPDYMKIDFMPRFDSNLHLRAHPSIPEVNQSRLYLIHPPPDRSWDPVLKFENAIQMAATLPGPLYYLKVRKPGPDIPMEVQLILPRQGHTLLTDKDGNYFRLHLNDLHCVDAMTCLGKREFRHDVYSQLYGKHEALFDKLLFRYQMEQIDDLFTYFTKPWMAALYQDSFPELMENIYEQKICNDESDAEKKIHATSCDDCQKEKLGTLRDVVGDYARNISMQHESIIGPSDIPTECGQSFAVRDKVGVFWDSARVAGDRIACTYLDKYLKKYNVSNPQYAPPDPACI